MSKIGQEVRAIYYEDFGDPTVFDRETILHGDEQAEIKEGWVAFELSHYTTEQLQEELARRGYVNGVLIDPSKDERDEQ